MNFLQAIEHMKNGEGVKHGGDELIFAMNPEGTEIMTSDGQKTRKLLLMDVQKMLSNDWELIK